MFKHWLPRQGAAPIRAVTTEMHLSTQDTENPMAEYCPKCWGHNCESYLTVSLLLFNWKLPLPSQPQEGNTDGWIHQRNLLNITFPNRCEMTMSGKAFVQPEIWTARLPKYLLLTQPLNKWHLSITHKWTTECFSALYMYNILNWYLSPPPQSN